jgi:fatty acid desaturase
MTTALAEHTREGTETSLSLLEGTRCYAQLHRDVSQAGILNPDYRYYATLITIIAAGLAASLFWIVRLPVGLPLVAAAVVFALFAVQVCGIVHDAGHRAIFRSTTWNSVVGEISGAFLGMGFAFWRQQHNVHHAHTNVDGIDPDLDIPLHVFSHQQLLRQGRLGRYLVRCQTITFYPLRTLVVFSRRLSSIVYFRRSRRGLRLVLEIMAWSIGLVAWFVVPFVLFPLPKAVLLFLLVHPIMGFYLSNVFAPNHKGMPYIPRGTRMSFLEQQIRTSRNITPGWLTDVVFMGLNYQIEHHLFPKCPRSKLKRLTPYVRPVCHRHNIPYTQAGILETNRIILAALSRRPEPGAH